MNSFFMSGHLSLYSLLCLSSLVSPQENAAKEWFLEWAEKRTPPGIHAHFTSDEYLISHEMEVWTFA